LNRKNENEQPHTYKKKMEIEYRTLIQTTKLTPQFCIEVILNDFVKKRPEDSSIGEEYIIKYQTHITEEDLDLAWMDYQTRNRHQKLAFFAEELTRAEKIVLLENKYKTIFNKMTFETRHAAMRKMIRKMRPDAWMVILQEKVYLPNESLCW
jgi:hypothetical protein